jgi:histone H3/H4
MTAQNNNEKRVVNKAGLRSVLKEVDNEILVSDKAIEELVNQLEELIKKKAKVIVDIAKNSKRKTVKEEDVKIAFNC